MLNLSPIKNTLKHCYTWYICYRTKSPVNFSLYKNSDIPVWPCKALILPGSDDVRPSILKHQDAQGISVDVCHLK